MPCKIIRALAPEGWLYSSVLSLKFAA